MADVKISALPAASVLTGVEPAPVVQGGATVKALVSQIGTYVRGLFTTTPATIAEGGTNAATISTARTSLAIGSLGASAGGTSAMLLEVVQGAVSLQLTGSQLTAYITAGLAAIGIKNTDIQTFTANGTWTKPSGTQSGTNAYIVCIGGGAGGGSARKGAAGSARSGGGGGAGGGWSDQTILASTLGATETVTVGAGGTGGTSVTTNSTNGNVGSAGGNSSLGAWVTANGGAAAIAAAAANLSAAAGGVGGQTGGTGGATNVAGIAANPTQPSGSAPGGGGGGGSISTGDATQQPGGGGSAGPGANLTGPTRVITSGAAGTAGTAAATGTTIGGTGGGGGMPSLSGNGGAGGAGALTGGGGGGGGAAVDSVGNSGAGGNGAAGLVVVITSY